MRLVTVLWRTTPSFDMSQRTVHRDDIPEEIDIHCLVRIQETLCEAVAFAY